MRGPRGKSQLESRRLQLRPLLRSIYATSAEMDLPKEKKKKSFPLIALCSLLLTWANAAKSARARMMNAKNFIAVELSGGAAGRGGRAKGEIKKRRCERSISSSKVNSQLRFARSRGAYILPSSYNPQQWTLSINSQTSCRRKRARSGLSSPNKEGLSFRILCAASRRAIEIASAFGNEKTLSQQIPAARSPLPRSPSKRIRNARSTHRESLQRKNNRKIGGKHGKTYLRKVLEVGRRVNEL